MNFPPNSVILFSEMPRAADRPRVKTLIMNKQTFYEAPEAECLVVIAERRFLVDSPTDFDEPATMTTLEEKSNGGIWEWME